MILSEVVKLNNKDLLELYADLVRVNHYDPCQTPEFAVQLRKNSISEHFLQELILKRMIND